MFKIKGSISSGIYSIPSLLLIICFSTYHSFAQDEDGSLIAKNKYNIEIKSIDGKQKPIADELRFTSDKVFLKEMSAQHGFRGGRYELGEAYVLNGVLNLGFTVTLKSEKDETLKITGTVIGEKIEGTAEWINKKGKKKRDYAFAGDLKVPKSSKLSAKKLPVKIDEHQIEVEYPDNMISADSLKKLKAIIICSDVDGPEGESTLAEIENGKEIEKGLLGLGIQVISFYCPYDEWSTIVAKAKGAHILVYLGHGTHAGENGLAGGFALSGGTIPAATIKKELRLHQSALVLFNSVCLSAGSSAGDTEDIGIKEATSRVNSYAHPFIDMGVSLYYANNYTGSSLEMILKILSRNPVINEYKNYVKSVNNRIVLTSDYDFNKDYQVNISSHKLSEKTTFYSWGADPTKKTATEVFIENEYDIALVVKKRFNVNDLFVKTE